MIEDRELEVTAELAQIELSTEDTDRLREAVSKMVDYFATMADVDVTGLAPMTHVYAEINRVRADVHVQYSGTDELLENAADLEDRFIAVPNVL
ncbi:MAG: Asp-tRNA(Asn)/Glu-tRNA(Gln) amidotransferase subunit GatC [Spirochaeta sp.]